MQKDIPLFVGFGISQPEHGKEIVNLGADGIIIGSAIIKRIEDNLGNTEAMISSVESFVKSMKEAITE